MHLPCPLTFDPTTIDHCSDHDSAWVPIIGTQFWGTTPPCPKAASIQTFCEPAERPTMLSSKPMSLNLWPLWPERKGDWQWGSTRWAPQLTTGGLRKWAAWMGPNFGHLSGKGKLWQCESHLKGCSKVPTNRKPLPFSLRTSVQELAPKSSAMLWPERVEVTVSFLNLCILHEK